jgi:hypothetical protein
VYAKKDEMLLDEVDYPAASAAAETSWQGSVCDAVSGFYTSSASDASSSNASKRLTNSTVSVANR